MLQNSVLAQILTGYNQKIAMGGRDAAIAQAQLKLGSMLYFNAMMLGFFGVARGSDVRMDMSKITGGERMLRRQTLEFTIRNSNWL